jgi:chromosome partitioning protein
MQHGLEKIQYLCYLSCKNLTKYKMSKKIVFFNHKGGVSKTTTTYNLGWMLGILGKKVLLVDADPQCNLSGLMLGDDFEKYYIDEQTKYHNIKDGVKVAFEGKPTAISAVNCFQAINTNVFLLAGHANLSEYDAALTFAQTSNNAITTLQNLPGAFNDLIEKTCTKYDIEFVLIDLNPGLSAINQNLFISCDAFIIPTNPDPFSIMALTALCTILPRWVTWAERMEPLFSEAAYPFPNKKPKFIGELIQRFNIRNKKPARPYRDNISEIKELIEHVFVPAIGKHTMLFPPNAYAEANISHDYCLSEISDFQGLLPKAHEAGVPVFVLSDEQIGETGSVLIGMRENRDRFYTEFENLTNKIITLMNYA